MIHARTSPGTVIATMLGVVVPVAFLAVFFAWPVAAMIGRGLADGLGRFGEGFSRPRTLRLVGLTLGQGALASIVWASRSRTCCTGSRSAAGRCCGRS